MHSPDLPQAMAAALTETRLPNHCTISHCTVISQADSDIELLIAPARDRLAK